MNPAPFAYFAPATVAEAVALLAAHRDRAKVLAGGHSLLPAMRLRLSQPGVLVDLGRIRDLSYVRAEGETLAIGAMTTHRTLETDPTVREWAPVLAAAAAEIGDPQVRNRGTIGGSVAHADPAADYPPVLLALGATFRMVGPNGTREVAAAEFFRGPFTTALGEGEILTEVRLPRLAAGSGAAYLKLPKKGSHFAIVGAAAYLELDGTVCRAARVALGGVAWAAYRAQAVEDALRGADLSRPEAVAAAAARAVDGVEPVGDHHCSAEFRAHLAEVYTRRAILAAMAAAGR